MKKEKIFHRDDTKDSPMVARFTVQLDAHTIITLRRLSSFEKWKERFPNARILDSSQAAA